MISWRDEAGALHEGSLFGAFAALARREAWSFPALRPHQREAWHAFTVQCAAMALIRAGRDDLPTEEATWRELLLGLSDGVSEAWELVVDDWSKPALLQPPVVAGANRAEYKNTLYTPDALDMLATAKNNDVKAERIFAASEEDWLFALVTLQTSEGYGGKDNHGISRMNGGLSSRMMLGVRPAGGATAAFRRDSEALLLHAKQRNERRGGRELLWSEPWDGTESLAFVALDELYVEVCRRVRLVRNDRRIVAFSATSKEPRVEAKALGGNTLDPWAPAIPQLGFVHEDSGISFVLDIADLHRHDVLLDIAFGAVKEARGRGAQPIERLVRKRAALLFRQRGVIPGMIDRIKILLMPGAALDTSAAADEAGVG